MNNYHCQLKKKHKVSVVNIRRLQLEQHESEDTGRKRSLLSEEDRAVPPNAKFVDGAATIFIAITLKRKIVGKIIRR